MINGAACGAGDLRRSVQGPDRRCTEVGLGATKELVLLPSRGTRTGDSLDLIVAGNELRLMIRVSANQLPKTSWPTPSCSTLTVAELCGLREDW